MPIREAILNNSDWLTVREVLEYAKISRSRLYNLMEDAAVRTVCLRRRGRTRGKRYVSRISLDTYFNTQCNSQMSN